MAIDEQERLRRWRLILGEDAGIPLGVGLAAGDRGMDRVLQELYGGERAAGLGSSAPNVTRWLGDIRAYFPTPTVQIMQQDALERLHLKRMLLEPELLAATVPDVQLVGALLSLSKVIPERTKETARQVVRQVVEEVERRLRLALVQAVTGSLNRATRRSRPRHREIDWERTIRLNLRHYLPERKTIIPERLAGHGRRRTALRDVLLCVDQSGSMASSLVYAGILGATLASIRALRTRLVVFDTAVVDLTDELPDPVELLFGVQLGGGTDISRALAYCQGQISRPAQTIFVLITDLHEGGDAEDMHRRMAEIVASGARAICLLALSDRGTPSYHQANAARLASLGVPTFGCTPDLFPDLLAAAIQGQDLNLWAARHEIVTARGG